eukprot:scaffold7801_cov112-Phaeocystis_antarctica.AAC.1
MHPGRNLKLKKTTRRMPTCYWPTRSVRTVLSRGCFAIRRDSTRTRLTSRRIRCQATSRLTAKRSRGVSSTNSSRARTRT